MNCIFPGHNWQTINKDPCYNSQYHNNFQELWKRIKSSLDFILATWKDAELNTVSQAEYLRLHTNLFHSESQIFQIH